MTLLIGPPVDIFLPQTVVVKAESDLPAPSAGVIQLECKQYIFSGVVPISNTLNIPITGGCFLVAENQGSDGINYTGTGDLFTAVGAISGNTFMIGMFFTSPDGVVYNMTAPPAVFLAIIFCIYFDVKSMGTLNTLPFAFIISSVINFGDGIKAIDNNGATFGRLFFQNGKNSVGSTMITISGTHTTVQISQNFFITAGSNETVLNIEASSSVNAGVAVGNSLDISAGGLTFDPASKRQDDIEWMFAANTGIAPSKEIGSFIVKGNATATSMTVQDQWEDLNLNASAVAGGSLERFTLTNTTTGEMRYDGREDFDGNYTVAMTLDSTGGAQTYDFRILVNGSVTPDGVELGISIAGNDVAMPFQSPVCLVQNDLVRMQVVNRAGSPRDITIKSIVGNTQ